METSTLQKLPYFFAVFDGASATGSPSEGVPCAPRPVGPRLGRRCAVVHGGGRHDRLHQEIASAMDNICGFEGGKTWWCWEKLTQNLKNIKGSKNIQK